MANTVKTAEAHMKRSAKALEVNFFKLQFKPDYFMAATEASEAAQQYTNARMEDKARETWQRAAELRLKDGDQESAARCFEHARMVTEAADNYMLCGKPDSAIRAILKGVEGQAPLAALASYEKALGIYAAVGEKEVMAADLYRQYLPRLLTRPDPPADHMAQYVAASKAYTDLLATLGHWPFVHKEILSQVVAHLARGDTVSADSALADNLNVEGFLRSNEFAAGEKLIAGMRALDLDAVKAAVALPAVTYLQVDVLRLAKSLVTRGGLASKPSPAVDAAPEEEGPDEDLEDMLR